MFELGGQPQSWKMVSHARFQDIDGLFHRTARQDLVDPRRRVRKVRRQTGQLRQMLYPWTSQPGEKGERGKDALTQE